MQEQINTKKQELINAQKSSLKASSKMKKISEIKTKISELNSQLDGYQANLRQKKTERDNLNATIAVSEGKIKIYTQRKNFYIKRLKEIDNEITILNKDKTKYEKQSSNYENLITSLSDTAKKYNAATGDEKVKYENSMVNYLRENLPDSFEISTKTTGSQILISSLSPYLKIISNESKTLLNIADNSYYLQTNDFVQHVLTNGEFTTKGQGMKLDLQNGKITSYNFDLLALDSSDGNNAGSYIRLSESGNPYLRVHFEDKAKSQKLNILEITKTNFYLCSHNWEANKEGINIDLTNGSITAFNNFNLKATINYPIDNDNERYNGSYVQIKSGNPFFTVHFEDSYSPEKNLDLIKIGTREWFMQSQDWVDGESGIRFDMAKGKITAYSFTIKAYRSENEYIYIDSTNNIEPLKIGSKFKVNWRGEVTASYITASGGKIGPFTINSSALYSGGNTLGSSGVYLGSAGLSVNNDLVVRTSPGANEHTLTVGGTSYFGGKMTVAGSLGVTDKGSITAAGNITANGTLTTNGSLVVAGGGSFGGDIEVTGNLKVSGTIHDSNDNWSSTGKNGGSQKLYGTSGNIGNWGINHGAISSGKTSLGSNGIITAGNITINGEMNNGTITFGNNANIYQGSSTLYLKGGSNGVQIGLAVSSSLDYPIVMTADTKVSGTFSATTIKQGSKELKALAFADDIKKKFNISYVNFDFWYKVNDKNITINKTSTNNKASYYVSSVYGYKKDGSSTYAIRKHSYVYYRTFKYTTSDNVRHYYTRLGFDGYPSGDSPSHEIFYSGYAPIPYDSVTVSDYTRSELLEGYYLYAHQDDITVSFSTVDTSGYIKKTLALSKEGTKKVAFGPNDSTDSSSDTITLTNIDFS